MASDLGCQSLAGKIPQRGKAEGGRGWSLEEPPRRAALPIARGTLHTGGCSVSPLMCPRKSYEVEAIIIIIV